MPNRSLTCESVARFSGRAPARAFVVGALALALGASATVGAGPADASTWPGTPAGVHVQSSSTSSVTVALHPAANARSYRLYASTYKPDLYYANLKSGHHSSARRTATSSRPVLTVPNLRYGTAPIWYRVVAANGSRASYSAGVSQAGLTPNVPAGLTGVSSSSGTFLTWTSMAATGFVVAQSSGASMTAGRRLSTVSDTSHQFTPSGLVTGRRYYFTVRALNGPAGSRWTAPVSVVVRSREQGLRVMSYNLLHLMFDGTRARGGVIAPWAQRRVAAAGLISSVDPDVVGVQEANDWANAARTSRQVDSLRDALAAVHRAYTVAHTEALVGEPAYRASGYLRTGNYILYKPSVYRPAAAGGTWMLATKVYAAYQLLQNVRTGARVLVVTTHLTQLGGHANDLARLSETRAMIGHASSVRAQLGVPVVYLGDFNSNDNPKQYTLDGAGSAMQAAHTADARLVAPSVVNPHWDSVNNYMRAPFHYDLYVDYIFLAPGVSVTQWGMALRMSRGQFVGVIPSDHNPIWAQLRFAY